MDLKRSYIPEMVHIQLLIYLFQVRLSLTVFPGMCMMTVVGAIIFQSF